MIPRTPNINGFKDDVATITTREQSQHEVNHMIIKFIGAIIDAIAYVIRAILTIAFACAMIATSIVAFVAFVGNNAFIAFVVAPLIAIGAILLVKNYAFPRRRNDDDYVDNATHRASMRAHGIRVDDDDDNHATR